MLPTVCDFVPLFFDWGIERGLDGETLLVKLMLAENSFLEPCLLESGSSTAFFTVALDVRGPLVSRGLGGDRTAGVAGVVVLASLVVSVTPDGSDSRPLLTVFANWAVGGRINAFVFGAAWETAPLFAGCPHSGETGTVPKARSGITSASAVFWGMLRSWYVEPSWVRTLFWFANFGAATVVAAGLTSFFTPSTSVTAIP